MRPWEYSLISPRGTTSNFIRTSILIPSLQLLLLHVYVYKRFSCNNFWALMIFCDIIALWPSVPDSWWSLKLHQHPSVHLSILWTKMKLELYQERNLTPAETLFTSEWLRALYRTPPVDATPFCRSCERTSTSVKNAFRRKHLHSLCFPYRLNSFVTAKIL